MNSPEIRERVVTVFEHVLGCDPKALRDTDSAQTVPGWDSVSHVQLLLAIEDEFGLSLAAEEFASLTNVAVIIDRIEQASE